MKNMYMHIHFYHCVHTCLSIISYTKKKKQYAHSRRKYKEKKNIILSLDNNNNNQSLEKRRSKKNSRNIYMHTNTFTSDNGFFLCLTMCVHVFHVFCFFYDIELLNETLELKK